jgi:hypothetical protein
MRGGEGEEGGDEWVRHHRKMHHLHSCNPVYVDPGQGVEKEFFRYDFDFDSDFDSDEGYTAPNRCDHVSAVSDPHHIQCRSHRTRGAFLHHRGRGGYFQLQARYRCVVVVL